MYNKCMSTNSVRQYYQDSQWLYRLICYNPRSLGMHFGYWEKGVTNRHEAMLAENQAVVDLAKISRTDTALDAGCGVGGTAIYIAKATGARVTGITIDPKQAALANKNAIKLGVTDLTHFEAQDYTQTNFADNHFDVVYGVESVCYSTPKSQFLTEALRILKPGGRLVILDGYLKRLPKNPNERAFVEEFKRSFALKEFVTASKMEASIQEAGYVNVRSASKMTLVGTSVQEFQRLAKAVYPLAKLLALFPSSKLKAGLRNADALLALGKMHKLGLADHAAHYAEKPRKK